MIIDKEAKIEYIKEGLMSRKPMWPKIAKRSTVSLRTIYSITNGEHQPYEKTIRSLYACLKRMEKREAEQA